MSEPSPSPGVADLSPLVERLRRVVLVVAALNFAYFFVEGSIALLVGSVSLAADSVDFLEDTAINLLIFLAFGWSLRARSLVGKLMVLVLLAPAAAAGWQAWQKLSSADPEVPAALPIVLVSLGAVAVNGLSAWLLARYRAHGGSLSRAAFLSARNDVLVNLAIIAMALLTLLTDSAWPDIVLGLGIMGIALHSAWEVWEVSEEERLASKALAGDVD
ncbi:cation diffusion facilitator family transporter [Marihabitans asiaticum]|uniref:Co/Zn/Cd efflux system component n=1 Tax=Marihabitans asiaticum TaxID=415218 RepID=A0A560W805_9MICO|nr:cation transporter [Marihabitans asiaticum]TWD13709.1 Co/Zn/Cd efflux system component [Marihabitans asiaticum]